MYPVRIIGINEGWKKLINSNPEEWHELDGIIKGLNIGMLADPDVMKHMHMTGEPRFSSLAYLWNTLVENAGWKRSRNRKDGATSFSLRNTKNGVATQMLTMEYLSQDFASLVMATIPRANSLGLCKVFVLFVPVDKCLELFPNTKSVSRNFIESTCRAQLNDLLLLIPVVPIVIVFFSQKEEDISVEEIETVSDEPIFLERSIEFAPEYYQAGVGVLSYFGEILRQKYPDVNAKVRIEQQGNIVRMHIETPNGDINIIEKELEMYALVIKKQAPIESLFQDKLQIMALENKLEVAQMEIRQAYKMLDLSESYNASQRRNYEQEVSFLRMQIGEALQLVTQQAGSHERIQIAQIGHASNLFKDLVGEVNGSQVLLNALRSLEYNLMSGIALIDVQDKIDNSLNEVRQIKPGLLNHIAGQIESGAYGAAAGYALEWIKLHVNS
jgi:hypothetical protein